MATLLQWNCRGLKANRSDIDLLISKYNPAAICIQETLIHQTSFPIRGYVSHDLFASTDNNGRPHGGVALLVHSRYPQQEIDLNTTLQAVAVRVTLHKTITICSLYIRPRSSINQRELDDLVRQLPGPFVLLGDFNAHNVLWGGDSTDSRGDMIENFISSNQLCLWNDKRPTYLHPATGSLTSIDLSICHPALFLDFK